MDLTTKKFFIEHKLEHLIPDFEREQLTTKDFNYLRTNMMELEKVVPRMRDRIDFSNALKARTVDVGVMVDMSPVFDPEQTLFDVLKQYPHGQQFMTLYEKHGSSALNQNTRKLIKYALVEHYISHGRGKISIDDFHEMTNLVTTQFEKEDAASWYAPAIDRDNRADGRLYNWYWYIRRHDARFKNDSIDKTSTNKEPKPESVIIKGKSKEKITKDEDLNVLWNSLEEADKNVCIAAKLKLKGLTMSCTEEISCAWNDSYRLRRYEALKGTLKLDDWDVLRHFRDIRTLVSRDFAVIHGVDADILHSKLPMFVKCFKNKVEGFQQVLHSNEELYSNVLKAFHQDCIAEDNPIFLAMYCLPRILRQHFVKKGNKKIKLSCIESQDAFLTLVETDARVNELVRERRSTAKAQKSTVQPFIIAVGTLAESNRRYFVVLDDILMDCRTIAAAVDLMFKLHSVLHLQYALECENVLLFIQKYFYDIHYPKEKRNSEVSSLISDLHNLG